VIYILFDLHGFHIGFKEYLRVTVEWTWAEGRCWIQASHMACVHTQQKLSCINVAGLGLSAAALKVYKLLLLFFD